MAILQYVRTKFGLGELEPDSALLAKALADTDGRVNKNQADTEALERELPAAVIRSIDAGNTERRKLAQLQSEHGALVATAAAIRNELAEARAREQAADLEKAWAGAEEKGRALKAAGDELTAAISTVWETVQILLRADADFRLAVPQSATGWTRERFAGNLARMIALQLYIASDGALRPAGVFESVYSLTQDLQNTIAGAIQEHIGLAFKGRQEPEASVSKEIDASKNQEMEDGPTDESAST